MKNLFRPTGPSEWAPIYGRRDNKESSQCSSQPSESKMNSFYEADFASVMVLAQSSQQRASVKGELWHDGGRKKKESTFTWLNAARSPAQLFLKAMHWRQDKLFLPMHFFQTRTQKQAFHRASSVTCSDLHSRLCQGVPDKRSWRSGRGVRPSIAGSALHADPQTSRMDNT